MNQPQWTNSIEQLIKHEHRDLDHRRTEIESFAALLSSGVSFAGAADRLREMLTQLRGRLERHFRQEDEGGYLDEAISRLPRLAAEASVLEHEHPALLTELDQLIAVVPASDNVDHPWSEVQQRLQAFFGRLVTHESAENRLLQTGFNQQLELDER